MRRLILAGAVAGTAGGLAMIPVGLVLGRVGYPLNVYGRLLVRTLLGSVPVWALVVEHFLIAWGMAVPLVALLPKFSGGRPIVGGALYGASIWLLVNSLLLPAVFGRRTPWQIGFSSIWPSLTVHLVYGAAAALVALWLSVASSRRGP